jgi:hypothetical protein
MTRRPSANAPDHVIPDAPGGLVLARPRLLKAAPRLDVGQPDETRRQQGHPHIQGVAVVIAAIGRPAGQRKELGD